MLTKVVQLFLLFSSAAFNWLHHLEIYQDVPLHGVAINCFQIF
jgi:hypothetical protein